MLNSDWTKPPLGEAIEDFTGRRGQHMGFTRALKNWDLIQSEIFFDPTPSSCQHSPKSSAIP
jgi:hypothetical protein